MAGYRNKHPSGTSGPAVRRFVDSGDGFPAEGVKGSFWLTNETIGTEMRNEASLLHDLSGPSLLQLVRLR